MIWHLHFCFLLTFLLLPTSLVSSSVHQFLFVNLVLPEQIHDRLYVGLSNDPLKMHLFIAGKHCSPAFRAFTHFTLVTCIKPSQQLINFCRISISICTNVEYETQVIDSHDNYSDTDWIFRKIICRIWLLLIHYSI